MTETKSETDVEMWEREDREREQAIKSAKLFVAWTAGWATRQFFKGAAMALGGWSALHLVGVL